jgi:anti-sigma-K factor RskA
MNYLLPERLDRLAREYALGTLAGRARRRFERVLRAEAAAAAAVARWQHRLALLGSEMPALAPRPGVWQGIERRLFAPAGDGAARRASLGARLAGWLGARTLGGALAGVLLAVVLLRLEPGLVGLEPAVDALPQSYVGLLSDAAGQPVVLLSARRHGRVLTAKLLAPMAVPPGAVAQLWALPKDGSAPFPVGTVPGSGTAAIALADDAERLFFPVSRLGVSFEAAPARAGERPSGSFVVAGPCVKLW